ncbi:GNAT family N-acetyltransferase [Dokdonia sp. Hel_I_53]|uniref:GNAT family N-acetyltransferase n=1 Tax=Dokdonia sp. Hel_I_53 TaxID=1566287 RepID=UPI00119BBEA5|nr:GNAT family N-acetyltransferase [Dokdonia sp. Hel_I_53]TVZ52480.1 hypothetical protein OD90_1655 [Dokdonia sp. Hel_I_53]
MSFSIRKATSEDMDGVLDLIKELAVFEKEPHAVKIDSEILRKYGLGTHPLFTCFVAAIKENIVGIALVYNRFSTWAGKSLHLEDLIVSQKYRGQGIGQSLYDRVMTHAHENDAKRVEWVVLDWNKNAIDFYKKSGAQFLKDWYLVQMDEKQLSSYVKRL